MLLEVESTLKHVQNQTALNCCHICKIKFKWFDKKKEEADPIQPIRDTDLWFGFFFVNQNE